MKLNIQLAENYTNCVLIGSYICQAKIDGIRVIATNEQGFIKLYTRQGNEILNCEHLKSELKSVLPKGYFLDGELFYNNFQSSLSEFRKDGSKLQFISFDYWNEELRMKPYTSRRNALKRIIEGLQHFSLVPQLEHKITPKEMKSALEYFVGLGHEGIILRKDTILQFGRTENLIKVKKFLDEEFICQSIEKTEKSFIAHFLTHEGKSFSTKATEAFYKKKKKFVGHPCSIRFQEYSSKGIPRFPVLVTCRNYE